MPSVPSVSAPEALIHTRLTVYEAFAFLALFFNVAVLVSAVFSRNNLRRLRAWYNLVIMWIVYSITYLLILGRQTGSEPPHGLCMVQAALVYACPSLCAVGYTCFAIDFYLLTCTIMFGNKKVGRWVDNTLLLALPWVIFGFVFLVSLLCINTAETVRREPNHHFYCVIDNAIPRMLCAVVITVSAVVLLSVEIYTIVILRRHWESYRRLSRSNSNMSLSTLLRLLLFTGIVFLAVGLAVVVLYWNDASLVGWSIMLPIVATLAGLLFGTQKDIILFWKKPQAASKPSAEFRSVGEKNWSADQEA